MTICSYHNYHRSIRGDGTKYVIKFCTLVNVYVDLLVFTRIAGTS